MARDKGRDEDVSVLFTPPLSKQEARLAFSHSCCEASSPISSTSRPALLCCPGKVQSWLSLLLQQVRGRDSCRALMILLGITLMPTAGGKGKRESKCSLPHQDHCITNKKQGQLSHSLGLGETHQHSHIQG